LKLNTACFPSAPIESDYLRLSHLVLLEPSPNSRSSSASQNLAQCRLGVEADHEELVTRFPKDECGATAIEYGLIAALLPLASTLRHEDLDLRSVRPSIWSQPRSRARSLRTSHEHSSQPCAVGRGGLKGCGLGPLVALSLCRSMVRRFRGPCQNFAPRRSGITAQVGRSGSITSRMKDASSWRALLRLASQLSRRSILGRPWFEAPTWRIVEVQSRGSRRPWS